MSVLLNSCTPVSLNNLPNTVSRRIVRNRNKGVARLGFTRRGGVRKTVSWQAAFGCSLGGRAASFRRFATVSAACGFKLKRPVSHAKTGHIAVRNRPFRNAKRPVSRRVSRRSAPVAVLFVKWAHSAFFWLGVWQCARLICYARVRDKDFRLSGRKCKPPACCLPRVETQNFASRRGNAIKIDAIANVRRKILRLYMRTTPA